MQQTKYKDNSSFKKSNNHKDNKKRGNKKQDNKDPRVSSTWATAPFNFIRFCKEVRQRNEDGSINYKVVDLWGKEHDLKEEKKYSFLSNNPFE